MKDSSCNGTARETQNETFLMTPNYPNSIYPDNKKCTWKLTVPPGRFILLDINFPNKGLGSECYDYFTVFDQFAPYTDNKTHMFCDSNKPPKVITSFGNEIIINFQSNRINGYRGFEIQYKFVKPGEKLHICDMHR